MSISVFHLFKIGIGPSSSHTVGPLKAARLFVVALKESGLLEMCGSVSADLYGSLALTGMGHGTDKALLLGLMGERPEEVEPQKVPQMLEEVRLQKKIRLLGEKEIPFDEERSLLFHDEKQLPYHPNGMRFTAKDADGKLLLERVFYSIGGGFILDHEEAARGGSLEEARSVPYPFHSGEQLLRLCRESGLSIQELMLENEKSWRSEKEVREALLQIWQTMRESVERGCRVKGILPGGLNVRRRAAALLRKLESEKSAGKKNPAEAMEWVSLWALAVNEENAAGGRIVTAPTNGAAGIIPAVLHYYTRYFEAAEEGIAAFLLVAGAMGILFKTGASISAAEMGCMGEVGVACAMAAGGLAAALGGTVLQVENAAEIGMEHNLGLTCDPVKGLVQIPCIERNTMGAVKAVNAAHLALREEGEHRVSLDQVIAAMKETGADMRHHYKETALGGLAVNVPEC